MRETVLYLAMSLDGYLADRMGGVGWLSGPGGAWEGAESSYPAFLQGSGDKRGGICFGGLGFVVQILTQLLRLREIFCQFSNQLLLLSRWRTVIREQFHSFPCSNVLQISTDRMVSIALQVGTFQDQSCHSSPSSQAPRTR